jgi:hypothetical protein
MKNYSSKQAKKGKTAYRTPSVKKYQLILKNSDSRVKNCCYAKKTISPYTS